MTVVLTILGILACLLVLFVVVAFVVATWIDFHDDERLG